MSQCQMCGREIPDGQQLCPVCRNAWEWRQRQQAQSDPAPEQTQDRPAAADMTGKTGKAAKPAKASKAAAAKAPQSAKPQKPPKAAKPAKATPAAKAPQPGRLPAVILGAVLVAFVLFFLAAVLFGSRTGGARTVPTLETWQGDGGTVEMADPGPDQVVAAAPDQSLPQQPTDPQQPAVDPGSADSSEYIFPNSDSAYLTRDQVAALTPEQLRLARNEIYARHGRIFQDETLAAYFGSKSWYQPLYDGATFDAMGDSVLNQYEIANRDLIQEYEALYNGQ